jgi:predicted nicotinamide N-methyase
LPTADFVRANARLRAPPNTPEIVLYVADEYVPLWERTEDELQQIGLPPPFWAFAWAGGQALARYILDRPEIVRGRPVLDLASGSGLVGIAAAKAGAGSVLASDIDPFALAAIALNAEANGVALTISGEDLLDAPELPEAARTGVVLAGDIFYERGTAARVLAFLLRCRAAGAQVLIGDPGRSYLPKDQLENLAEYSIPVSRELEDNEIKRTAVWAFR